MRHLLIAMTLFTSGCALRNAYPIGGAIVGGGAGAIAGPAGGAVGAGVGYGVGKIAALSDEKKELIGALSQGDVEGLIAAGMGKQKGFMDSAIDTNKS